MNPFAAMSNPEHAKALAQMFVCLHLHAGRSSAEAGEQLSAMLRLYNRQQGERLGDYLDGCHFGPWQDQYGNFWLSNENFTQLQERALSFLGE